MTATTFKGSVSEFIKANPWLGPAHAPAVVTLRKLAVELDKEVTAALTAQFGVTFRALQKQAPAEEPTLDPITQALKDAGKL